MHEYGELPLYRAIRWDMQQHSTHLTNPFTFAEKLIEKDAHLNACNRRGASILYHVIKETRNIAAVHWLLSQEGHPKQADKNGNTPFHAAAAISSPEIILALRKALPPGEEAIADFANGEGITPAQLANEKEAVIQALTQPLETTEGSRNASTNNTLIAYRP